MVNESLEKGWRTWSAEAAELQLLRGDRDNQETQGSGFFKMSEEAMAVMQEDLAHDLYELETSHREEITRLMEEFDALDIDTSVKLDDLGHLLQLNHHHHTMEAMTINRVRKHKQLESDLEGRSVSQKKEKLNRRKLLIVLGVLD